MVAVPHLSGRVFPSTASTRTWLTDAADLPPLLRGDRATVVRPRRPGARHLRRQRSKAAVGQDLRPQAPPRSAPHRRGTPAAVRGDHPRRGHAAAVRSPLGRHRDQTPRPVGVPLRAQGHHRTVGGRPAIRAVSSSTGHPPPPTVSRTRCGTRLSKRSGRPTRRARRARRRRPRRRAGGARDVGRAGRRRHDRRRRLGGRRRRAARRAGPRPCEQPPPALPAQVSVSTLVELGRDPDAVAQRLRRRLPTRPDPHALLRHRVSRLGAAVLRRRAAVRPRRPARCGRLRHRARRRGRLWPSCRPRSRCRRGPRAPRSTSRCRSTW